MKTSGKTLAIVLLFVGLVLVNYLASSIPLRLDATAEKIYSLSPGTRAMLGRIEDPVTLDLYYSKDSTGRPIWYKNYAERVLEMLRQYVRASRGKLVLRVINPTPDSPEEEAATAAGLSPQATTKGGEQFFFGLVAIQSDQQQTIPAFTIEREQFLEYDLSKLIHSVQQLDKPKLGLLTSLPLQGSGAENPMMMMGRRPDPPQFVVDEWKQSFNLVTVESSATELPANLDALAIIHPQNLSAKLQFAIDQFLLAGKPVFLAVDPSSQYFKQAAGQQQMFGASPQGVSSDLPQLLAAYGVAYDPQKVVGDLDNATKVQAPDSGVARYPTWISLTTANFSAQSLPTAELKSALFVEAGALSAKPGAGTTFTPLIETSAQTGDVPAMMLQFGDADALSKQISPSGKKTIAALVTGKFKTAFPDGAPKDPADKNSPDAPKAEAAKPEEPKTGPAKPDAKPTAAAPAPLKESKTTSTLLVVADTDWLLDDYSVQKFNYFGQVAAEPLNDNLAFASNSVEYLGGSQDLISIRGKGVSLRRFTVVQAMEVEAQKKYQDKLTELDARLQEVEKKLTDLTGKKTEGNRLVATPEMTKAIEDFQKQQATLRRERREIVRSLRHDIDVLEKRLLWTNLLFSPLLVCGFGIWFYYHRRK